MKPMQKYKKLQFCDEPISKNVQIYSLVQKQFYSILNIYFPAHEDCSWAQWTFVHLTCLNKVMHNKGRGCFEWQLGTDYSIADLSADFVVLVPFGEF